MSARTILITLGWVPVLWLVIAQFLVDRRRLPRDGAGLRVAGCAAAIVVVTAGVFTQMWPVAALGLLWLRTEVFAHRHPIHEFQAYREQARRDAAPKPTGTKPTTGTKGTAPVPLKVADLVGAQRRRPAPAPGRAASHVTSHTAAQQAGRRTAYKAEHPPKPQRLGPRTVDAIFKIEVIIVVIVALVLFGSWAESHRSNFNRKANTSVCQFLGC
jgi:hypothetical protein